VSGGDDKTEKPTPKKLREARREGRVARSQDIGAWVGVLAGCYLLKFTVASGGPRLGSLFERIPALIAEPTEASALALFVDGARTVAILLVPLCLGLAIATFVASAAQGGVHLATKNLKPQFKRMNPIAGFKRIAGPHAGWEAAKTLTKTAIAGIVAYRAVKGTAMLLTSTGAMPLPTVLDIAAGVVFHLIRDVSFAGLLMGVVDYAYQRRGTGKQLKMTVHEVKQENKQTEGDPHMKGAIRSKQMAMSRNRMMSKIASADVVLVNPTHVAVALQYRPDRGAPRVVAKGSGHIATKIREEASKHRVPMVSDVPLARALYKACNLEQEIPGELFAAVAQVLAFVLSLKSRGSAAGTHKVPALLGR
jgi:flagellar biosynthetic protein FlhB